VFDISHMGQLIASGPNAREWLNRMLTNNVDKLEVRGGQYTFLLNQNGGIIDDLIVYRIELEKFLLVVNASRTDEDFAWLQAHILPDVELTNRSDDYAGLAIQGPRVGELLKAMLGEDFELPARNTIADVEYNIMQLAIARTGYTGEDGVEVFFPAKYAPTFWTTVLELGKPLGIRACGLGARDTLRLEMCYPLNGNDLTPEHTPLEAGLGFFCDLTKPNFTGREVLATQKAEGLKRRLAPFRMNGKGPPPRPHYTVFRDDEKLGEVNSGTLSPSLGYGIGMAYLPAEHAKVGTELQIEIRGQKFPAVIEKKPLYKKQA
ncbi:MAG TPA: glycine cleavage system aminomethyltransferase GcvT, partial [Chthoniobacterales bacterium]|nr:glycine cleavage system aminomethyltransferase GcvT [Chthoniobacterales bacterium]